MADVAIGSNWQSLTYSIRILLPSANSIRLLATRLQALMAAHEKSCHAMHHHSFALPFIHVAWLAMTQGLIEAVIAEPSWIGHLIIFLACKMETYNDEPNNDY
ncbi:MAG: hypothetical protein JW973_16915 [Bacteroidales bacterium]|nr:hypothetical protein [Bacteroidales bacterium]